MTQPAKAGPAPSIPRMSADLVQHLVIYLLAVPRVATEAQKVLEPKHFNIEPHFEVLWGVVKALHASYGVGSVPFDALYLTVGEAIDQSPVPIMPALRALLLAMPDDIGRAVVEGVPDSPTVDRPGLLHYAYNSQDIGLLDPKYGIDLLKRFLEERSVLDVARRVLAGSEEAVPGDFETTITEVRDQLLRVRGVGRDVDIDFTAMPEEPEALIVEPTGIGYLDGLLGGGHVAEEVYMIFGPWKSGKSFAMIDLVESCAEQFYLQAQQGLPCKVAYYFSYELSKKEIKQRVAARGADISLRRLMYQIRKNSDYSRRGALLDYERAMYQAKGMLNVNELPGEFERYNTFAETVGQHVKAVDFRGAASGFEDGQGSGGIDEIAGYLRQKVAEGKAPGMIVIDYTNRVVDSYLGARGKDFERFGRSEVIRFVRQCYPKLGIPFGIPVWLVQQYGKEGNETLPTKKLAASMAAESKTVGADINMCLCWGARDPESNVSQVVLDLTRRTENQGATRLVQLQADRARWVDVTGQYELIHHGEDAGAIVKKGAASAAKGVDAAAAEKLAVAHPDPYKVEAQAEKPAKPKKQKKGAGDGAEIF